ncbi:MAG TPA: HlyD family efflux transporter periplasmic adaptor subunit [Pirellulales bacterium]|jgi:macrolide-specific efflux system membrane fusion protein|nr:HlyD family efflux transporter periplasmic adaptor subunit [Pirellulales bacterium]
MHSVVALWTMTLVVSAPPQTVGAAARPPAGLPVLQQCTVSLVEEVQIPAQEAGVLSEILAHEGDQVTTGTPLAHLDDSQPRVHRKAAYGEYMAAKQHAENDINVRFSKAAYAVADNEYRKALEAVKKTAAAFSDVELDNKQLAAHKAKLQIEQSEVDQKVAQFTADTKAAEVENADQTIARRQIKSPFDGIVVSINHHAGEWLQAGEPVLRVVRMDRLGVEGWVNSAEFGPEEISNKPALIDVELARGRHAKFQGKIVFVSPLVEAGGEYRIKAEVENRRESDEWVLRPGYTATMTIQLR